MTTFTLPDNKTLEHYFSLDYVVCRRDFLEHAKKLETPKKLKTPMKRRLSWLVPGHPEHSIDSAWIGNPDAHKVLVVISATHGVEGYCGSAAQRYLLKHLADAPVSLPADVAILMIHALNPWGMDKARRADHQGIDLNRNFIDFETSSLAANPDYNTLGPLLTETDRDERRRRMSALATQLGQTRFERALSGGQHINPWAPFYGGERPAFANITVNNIIKEFALADRELTVIDIHSGLGPWAFGELISDHPTHSNGNVFAKRIFGEAVAVTESGESFSVLKSGLMDYRWHQLMQDRGCFLTLEFGTYGTAALFDVLLDEHLAWRTKSTTGTQDNRAIESARQAMLKHFFPSDLLWRQSVLFKSWQVLDRYLAFYS